MFQPGKACMIKIYTGRFKVMICVILNPIIRSVVVSSLKSLFYKFTLLHVLEILPSLSTQIANEILNAK